MSDPVICSDGFTYERSSILILPNNLSPMTRQPIDRNNLIPNLALRHLIEKYAKSNNITLNKPVSTSSNLTSLSNLNGPIGNIGLPGLIGPIGDIGDIPQHRELRIYQLPELPNSLKYLNIPQHRELRIYQLPELPNSLNYLQIQQPNQFNEPILNYTHQSISFFDKLFGLFRFQQINELFSSILFVESNQSNNWTIFDRLIGERRKLREYEQREQM
jgi:hypothetical protein